jgi:hypothetical protein
MTDTDNKRYAEILQFVMLQHGVLQKVGPDQYRVISDDCKKVAACFQQAELIHSYSHLDQAEHDHDGC